MITWKKFFVAIVALVVLSLIYLALPQKAVVPGDDLVVCTMDAMQCPDGTWVGRTGPNCEFVCPSVE